MIDRSRETAPLPREYPDLALRPAACARCRHRYRSNWRRHPAAIDRPSDGCAMHARRRRATSVPWPVPRAPRRPCRRRAPARRETAHKTHSRDRRGEDYRAGVRAYPSGASSDRGPRKKQWHHPPQRSSGDATRRPADRRQDKTGCVAACATATRHWGRTRAQAHRGRSSPTSKCRCSGSGDGEQARSGTDLVPPASHRRRCRIPQPAACGYRYPIRG